MVFSLIETERGEEKRTPIWLERVHALDFRSFDDVTVEPSQGVNLISGANGQGKTSLLEAIALLSTGRILRGSRDAQAVKHGRPSAQVSGRLGETGTLLSVELRPGVRKRVLLNGMPLPRSSDLIGRMPTVSFSSADLGIVTGEPADRRAFMDEELAQLFPAYLKHLTVYRRALDHRNALLRHAQEHHTPREQFEPWEEQLAVSGAAIRKMRAEWVQELVADAREAHATLGGGEELSLKSVVRDDALDADQLAAALASDRSSESARGSTAHGPHRDDLLIEVQGTEARHFGSQGQQRSAVIAIKLGVLASVCRVYACPPVLLLDDVFSDLDSKRRARLMELTLGCGGQVFLTCTEAEQASQDLVEKSRCFWVESGKVLPA